MITGKELNDNGSGFIIQKSEYGTKTYWSISYLDKRDNQTHFLAKRFTFLIDAERFLDDILETSWNKIY